MGLTCAASKHVFPPFGFLLEQVFKHPDWITEG